MPRPKYPADTPNRCAACDAPCAGQRCAPCDHARRPGMAKRGTPVRAPDGRAWASVAALARAWGTSHQNAYNHMEWAGDHWRLLREPDPRNRHRRGGPYRIREEIPNVAAD